MPRYQCPECEAILKRDLAVPAGKKLKCPKCAFIFAPKALPEAVKPEPAKKAEPPKLGPKKEEPVGLAAPPAPVFQPAVGSAEKVVEDEDGIIGLADLNTAYDQNAGAIKLAFQPTVGGKDKVVEDEDGAIGLAPETDSPNIKNTAQKKKQEKDDEDEGAGNYGVLTEKKEDAPEVNFGSLRDKFAKSKIGPAMYMTVGPSNWLLRLGLFSCTAAVLKAFYDVFPLIFCEVAPLRPFIRPQITLMLFDLIVFGLGAVMCSGASRLHDLGSFAWAIIGSVMAIVIYMPICIAAASILLLMFGPTGLMMAIAIGMISFVGVWCLIVIFKPAVREGFKERETQGASG